MGGHLINKLMKSLQHSNKNAIWCPSRLWVRPFVGFPLYIPSIVSDLKLDSYMNYNYEHYHFDHICSGLSFTASTVLFALWASLASSCMLHRLQFPQLALRRRLGQLSCMSRPTARLRSWPLSFLHYILPFAVLKPLAKVGWRPTSRVSLAERYYGQKKKKSVCVICVWNPYPKTTLKFSYIGSTFQLSPVEIF